MKILSLSCVFPNTNEPGLGTFVRARLQAMATGNEIHVIAPLAAVDYSRLFKRRQHVAASRQDGRLAIAHPHWFYLPGGAAVNPACLALRVLPVLRTLRKRYPFEWIDSHFAFPDGIAAALLAQWFQVPFSITLRGNETMHAARSKFIRASMRWAFRRARCIVTVSESLRQFAITLGADPETTRTIPNGINHRIFYPRDRELCRARLNLPSDRKVVVCAGYLIERKGHHHVMRAIQQLAARGLDPLLLIVGGPGREGNFSARLHRLPSELGIADRVRFLGHLPPESVTEVLSSADLFCLASSREGWPNVVHEAMACGAPVVTTNVGGTPDMIPSPAYGAVVPPGDQAALEFAMEAALLKPWNRDVIRDWAHSRSWEKVAAEVLQLFQNQK